MRSDAFIPKPGFGKRTFSSAIIEDIATKSARSDTEKEPSPYFAFFYFNHTEKAYATTFAKRFHALAVQVVYAPRNECLTVDALPILFIESAFGQ